MGGDISQVLRVQIIASVKALNKVLNIADSMAGRSWCDPYKTWEVTPPYYTCVLILLCMCPRSTVCVLVLLYLLPYYYVGVLITYYCIHVRILLHI